MNVKTGDLRLSDKYISFCTLLRKLLHENPFYLPFYMDCLIFYGLFNDYTI
jgi:hypothetical protein